MCAHTFTGRTRSQAVQNSHGNDQNDWVISDDGAQRSWQRADLHLVLVNPQIPQNAGNIARSCAATEVALHLVGPLGFELDDVKLRRAGLDYWHSVAVKVHTDWETFHQFFQELAGPKRLVAFSKLGRKHYAGFAYHPGDWLLFGAETTGLPDEAHVASVESGGGVVKIPMKNYKHVRSLNLATSVGIGLFEALRQLDGTTLPEEQGAE